MNADYINPFLQGSQTILSTICGESPVLGNLFIKNQPYACLHVSIEVGIIGDLQGSVVYTMEANTACDIASKMMFGMPVAALDEMSQSAISELANMISGTVATIFSEKGQKVDITTPVVRLSAAEGDFSTKLLSGKNVICVPLKFQNGNVFEVDVFF